MGADHGPHRTPAGPPRRRVWQTVAVLVAFALMLLAHHLWGRWSQ